MSVVYNGTSIDKIVYNGVEIFGTGKLYSYTVKCLASASSDKETVALELNGKLKWTNQSTIGSSSSVNGMAFSLYYSDDGKTWTKYNITSSTTEQTSEVDWDYASTVGVGNFRYQWTRNNSNTTFTTKERHKYWKIRTVTSQNKYDQQWNCSYGEAETKTIQF